MIIEQYLPAFHYGDAIGNSTLRFHHFLQGKGIESRIVTLTVDECLRDRAHRFRDYRPDPRAVKILHFAIPSELTPFFIQTGGRRVMIYHNITPASFFVDFSPSLVRFTHAGREHLNRLRDTFDLSIADSAYNASELSALGYRNVHAFPIMIDPAEYQQEYSSAYFRLLKDERRNIIFVGRITPNKKVEDLIRTLFFYKKYLNPSIRLVVAGNTRTLPAYYRDLENLASRFLLTPDDIFFTGHIPLAELLAVYRLGDLFLSMSEHEGFCLPLIESCLFEIPVIAYDAGAVAETLGGSGLLLRSKDPARAAALAERVLEDPKLKNTLKHRARERIGQYRQQSDPRILLEMIQKIPEKRE